MPFSTIPKGSILRLKKKLRTKLKPKKITIQLNIQKNIVNLDMSKEVTKPPIHRLILASSKRLGIETYKKTSLKILFRAMTSLQIWNVNTNLLALIIFWFDHKKCKNRIRDKPENFMDEFFFNTNSPALKFFRFDHQKCKNRKPDKKPDPGQTWKFYGWMFMSIQIHLHWNFLDLIIRSTKTGNRTENRTLVQKNNFHKSCGII